MKEKTQNLNIYLLFIMLCAAGSFASAQVWVKGNSFIYSKGTNLFVKDKIDLEANSKIYLRKEAQLIQANDVANSGSGILSVFQEGTRDEFAYNYWSAPVSDESTGTGNSGFKNTQIHFPLLQVGFRENSFVSGATTNLETDLVINSQQADISAIGVRNGMTDDQALDGSGVNTDLLISGRWLYSYNSFQPGAGGGGYIGWQRFHASNAVVDSGYGFTMKGVDGTGPNIVSTVGGAFLGQRYDFRGRPNNGDITVGVAADDNSLVGNPYPSALDLKKFLIENASGAGATIDDAVFFWESQPTTHFITDYEGGFATYAPGDINDLSDNGMYTPATFSRYDRNGNEVTGPIGTGGPTNPQGNATVRRFAPVGQGFLITRDAPFTGTGTAVFKNDQRVFQKEDARLSFFKAAPGSGNAATPNTNAPFVRPKIRLNVKVDDAYIRQMIIAFGDTSTNGKDWGLDAENSGTRIATDSYMVMNGEEYVIQTIPFNLQQKVALGVDAVNPTTFEFKVNRFENFSTPEVFIHDKLNDTYHDILNDAYEVSLPAGQLDDRFEVVFEQNTTLSEDLFTADDLDVVQNNSKQLLSVINPNNMDIANIALFDLGGKMIFNRTIDTPATRFEFNTTNYSNGIYIVRVTDTNAQEVAVKISVDK